MTYKGFMFDLDGTLLDTINDIASSMNSVLTRYGLHHHTVDKYKQMVGSGVEELVRLAAHAFSRDETMIKQLTEELRLEYSIHWADTTRVYPGIIDSLKALRQAGIVITVLSNKPDEFTKNCIAHMISEIDFAWVQGAQPGIPRKPDPASALGIGCRLGIDPDSWIFIGDSDIDMKTAVNAGMLPVGAMWGFRTAAELSAHGARYLLQSPADLTKLLDL